MKTIEGIELCPSIAASWMIMQIIIPSYQFELQVCKQVVSFPAEFDQQRGILLEQLPGNAPYKGVVKGLGNQNGTRAGRWTSVETNQQHLWRIS